MVDVTKELASAPLDDLLQEARVLHQQRRLPEAEVAARTVVRIAPGYAEAHYVLGFILGEQGKAGEAEAAYAAAVALDGEHDDARINLGIALFNRGSFAEAVEQHLAVARRRPAQAENILHLGQALKAVKLVDQAFGCFERALALKPTLAEAHNAIGVALEEAGRVPEALAAYRREVAVDPAEVAGWANICGAQYRLGDPEAAVAAGERAVCLAPEFAPARSNLALALLQNGDYRRGFPAYEWRWRCRGFPTPPRDDVPAWNGKDSDLTVLVHAEQGYGDSLQCLRFVPELAKRVRKVVVEVPLALWELCGDLGATVYAQGQLPPAFDAHVPMMSLPGVLGMALDTLPARVPYLTVPPARLAQWAGHIAGPGRKVGLVWAGRPEHPNDANRTIPLDLLAPALRAPGLRLYSLQKEWRPGERDAAKRLGLDIVDLAPGFTNFADTAAVVSALDLVVAVDTAVAHLAGALARPVWIMLPFGPDWRWLIGRDDSPWYPTVRLFRQSRFGDWTDAVERLGQALNDVAGGDQGA